MNYPTQRRQTLTRNLKKHGVDAVLVTGDVNITYLTGFTGDSSYYVANARHSILVSDDRFEVQIKQECPEVGKGQGFELHIRPHNKTTLEAAAEVLAKINARNVGVEGNRLTLAELEALQDLAPKLNFVPIANLVESQRVLKDQSEIEHIREAVRVAERAFRMFVATLRETDSEKEMADTLEGYVRRAGARGTPFPPIVAVGDRGALPHAPPTGRRLGEGSKLLVDWGADLLYKSDITRTIRSPFQTTPTRRNKMERVGYNLDQIYAIVLEAQNAALAAVRDGANAKDVDAAARSVIGSAKIKGEPGLKLGDYFTHGLGHGIGLEAHEAPRVRANSDDVLEAGMVITIEPGVYIPNWGGVRIEDDVLVMRDVYMLLTSLPRELPPAE
ncbi:MAG TPA: Xaa-Pro peptidase family protein [Gemmataceae bacterium]|nr:Xaa-Pro peptidase family protein [Gemmataceae bacterium]